MRKKSKTNQAATTIDIDRLLQQSPSEVNDARLDAKDLELKLRIRNHNVEMEKEEKIIDEIYQDKLTYESNLKRNSILRDRLEMEMNEDRLRNVFGQIKEYLINISEGKGNSARHTQFHGGIRSRHNLYYSIINHPFTEAQVEWAIDELSKVRFTLLSTTCCSLLLKFH